MILQKNSIKRGDWLLNVPLNSCHLVKLLNDPHQVGRLIANAPLFMLLLIIIIIYQLYAVTNHDVSFKTKSYCSLISACIHNFSPVLQLIIFIEAIIHAHWSQFRECLLFDMID